jgi:hypothetical protein
VGDSHVEQGFVICGSHTGAQTLSFDSKKHLHRQRRTVFMSLPNFLH